MQFIQQNRNQCGFRMFNTLILQGSHRNCLFKRLEIESFYNQKLELKTD